METTQKGHAPNQWGGVDYNGPNGMARQTVEDSEKHVYAFAPNGVLVWQVSASATAPSNVTDAAWLAARAYADTDPADDSKLSVLQRDVIALLIADGVKAEYWHSGGGIMGIQITVQPEDYRSEDDTTLFTTLNGEGHDAWLHLDWNADDGDLIGCLEVQARPFNPSHGEPSKAVEIADALAGVVKRLA